LAADPALISGRKLSKIQLRNIQKWHCGNENRQQRRAADLAKGGNSVSQPWNSNVDEHTARSGCSA
jgi:hypothetical protein